MASDLNLAVRVGLKDQFSAPAKGVAAAGDKLTRRLDAAQKELAGLAGQAGKIDRYKALEKALGKSAAKMDAAKKETSKLGRALREAEKPTKKMERALEASQNQTRRLVGEHRRHRSALETLRGELREAGVDTRRLGEAQDRLAAKSRAASAMQERLGAAASRAAGLRAAAADYGQRAMQAGVVAMTVGGFGGNLRRLLTAPMDRSAAVGRARGRLASLEMSAAGIAGVVEQGRAAARGYSGISVPDFVNAAYDIRSAISELADKDIGGITAAAAVLARAADAEVGSMTGVLSSGYGAFKGSSYADLTPHEFTEKFSAMLSETVKGFRTTGSAMEQAIASMGGDVGLSTAETLAVLGRLQTSLQGAEAGTALKSVAARSVKADEFFRKQGLDIRALDAHGRLRSLAAVTADMRRVFGAEIDEREKAIIQQAYQNEYAARVFTPLLADGAEKLAAAAQAIEEATFDDVRRRAKEREKAAGAASGLDRLRERWNIIMGKIGDRLTPMLDRAAPAFERLFDGLETLIDRYPVWTSILAGLVAGAGALVAPLASLGIQAVALYWAFRQLKGSVYAWGLDQGLGGGGFAGGGGKAPKGGGFKGWMRGSKNLLRGKGGWIGAGLGALTIGSTLFDREMSAAEKADSVTTDLGGIAGGMLGGAAAGAALGSVLPGIGTAIGFIGGGMLGGIAGSMIGDKVGDQAAKMFAPAGGGSPEAIAGTIENRVQNLDNSITVGSMNFHQQPGENPQEMADRVIDAIEQRLADQRRGVLYD